jgi:hypothetical protein
MSDVYGVSLPGKVELLAQRLQAIGNRLRA